MESISIHNLLNNPIKFDKSSMPKVTSDSRSTNTTETFSIDFEAERQAMESRQVPKSYTVLYGGGSTQDPEDGTVSTSSSDSSSTLPSSSGYGLHLIKESYTKRKRSPNASSTSTESKDRCIPCKVPRVVTVPVASPKLAIKNVKTTPVEGISLPSTSYTNSSRDRDGSFGARNGSSSRSSEHHLSSLLSSRSDSSSSGTSTPYPRRSRFGNAIPVVTNGDTASLKLVIHKRLLPNVTDDQSARSSQSTSGVERRERRNEPENMDNSIFFWTTWNGSELLNQMNGHTHTRNSCVGLVNPSSDCFMNSVLQLLGHTPPIARYAVEKHLRVCRMRCIMCEFANHIQRAIAADSPIQPLWMNDYLTKIFPNHIRGHQEDAHEFLTYFLSALESCTTRGPRSTSFSPPAPRNPSKTPVQEIFDGVVRNRYMCVDCKASSESSDTVRCISMSFPPERNGHVHLNEIIRTYFAKETVDRRCDSCHRNTKSIRSSRIVHSPKVLLLHFKRFSKKSNFGVAKIDTHIDFEMGLDFSRYVEGPKSHNYYTLYGIVEHLGGSVESGHYIAYIRGFDGRQWRQLNDRKNVSADVNSVRSSQVYLMVYVRTAIETDHTVNGPLSPYSRPVHNGITHDKYMKQSFSQSYSFSY